MGAFDPATFDVGSFDAASDDAVTFTFHGRVTSVDVAPDATGTTVTARIEHP